MPARARTNSPTTEIRTAQFQLSTELSIGARRSEVSKQDFNSLDAQREACEAFIASQKREGWSAIGEIYNDGGFVP
jgi:hypothetical protein